MASSVTSGFCLAPRHPAKNGSSPAGQSSWSSTCVRTRCAFMIRRNLAGTSASRAPTAGVCLRRDSTRINRGSALQTGRCVPLPTCGGERDLGCSCRLARHLGSVGSGASRPVVRSSHASGAVSDHGRVPDEPPASPSRKMPPRSSSCTDHVGSRGHWCIRARGRSRGGSLGAPFHPDLQR